MKNYEIKSQTFLRKRKMLLILPLLVIPFLTMAFWAMGGGIARSIKSKVKPEGLNLNLPDPKLKEDKLPDKLSFYDKADKDSIKLVEEMRNDPYYKSKDSVREPAIHELEQITESTASKFNQQLNVSPYDKANKAPEEKVMEKLKVLQMELDKNPENVRVKEPDFNQEDSSRPQLSNETDRLEKMMNLINGTNNEDTEMKQINVTLDKILDIQHPERIKKELPQKNGTVFTVKTTGDDDTEVNGFYGLETETVSKASNSIEAVVNEYQTLVNGSVIKLRLLNDIFIQGSKIPSGNFVFGIVSLNGERLDIQVNSIKSGNDLFDVKLEVFDMDGLAGIYIPGAITRDVAKQSADNSLQLMEMTSLDPSFKAQATSAGIGSLKNLLSRKVKEVKVSVKAGYKILLKNKV